MTVSWGHRPLPSPPSRPTIDEILVAGDGMPGADPALAWAMDRVAQTHEALRLLRSEEEGHPVDTLVDASGPHRLLVVGHAAPRDHGVDWSHLTSRLVHRVHGPLAVVPEEGAPSSPSIDRPVIVGLGSSGSDEGALELAAAEAARLGRPLRVVHAWLEPTGGPAYGRLDPVYARWVREGHREAAQTIVDEFAGRHPELIVDLQLLHGDPVHALSAVAAGAPLLVIGAGSRNVLTRAVNGSVSTPLAAHPPCPVIVVPEADHGFEPGHR